MSRRITCDDLPNIDEPTVSMIMEEIIPEIKNTRVYSTGPKKTQYDAYTWRDDHYQKFGAAGIESEIMAAISQIKSDLSIELSEYVGMSKEDDADRDRIRSKIKAVSGFLNTTKRRSLEATIMTLHMEPPGAPKMDSNRGILGGQKWVYDLYAHTLLEPTPEMLVSKQCSCEFSANAEAPKFKENLEYLIPDPDTREYFLQAVASALLRGRREELIFFLWGPTANNGKSELISAIITALGDYATWMDTKTFTSKRAQNSTQPELLMGLGKCIAVIDEPAKDDMDDSTFKNAANFSSIVARGLYENSEARRWTATVFMLCNQLPTIDMKDAGVARRPVVIPFYQTITEQMKENDRRPTGKEIDKYGMFIGEMEAAGIMNILFEALKRYQANNYRLPPKSFEMTQATNEYIYQNNMVARFVSEAYERDHIGHINAKCFHDAFRTYCNRIKDFDYQYIMKAEKIVIAMQALGFRYDTKKIDGKTERVYLGIRLKTSADVVDDSELKREYIVGPLGKDIMEFLKYCRPTTDPTTKEIVSHFADRPNIDGKRIAKVLKQMSTNGIIMHHPNDTWGYAGP